MDNVVQVITDNAKNCAGTGTLVHQMYPHIFWTSCVVHTLNFVLQNICTTKNAKNNVVTFEEYSWITEVVNDC